MTVGISDGELILFFPKDKYETLDISEYDWPPRIIFHFTAQDETDVPADLEETYYLDFSALLDRITLSKLLDKWQVTLYMHRSLRKNIDEGDTHARLRVEYLGTWLDLMQQGEGWRLWEVNRFLTDGAQHAFIAQINPLNPATEVRISTASQFGNQSNTVEEYVRFNRAVGGVNGGYFFSKFSLGMVVVKGEIASLPMLSRPVLAFADDGTPYIGYIHVVCNASIGERNPIYIETIDDFPHSGPVLLTPGHPSRVRGDFEGLKVIIMNDVIQYVTDTQVDDLVGKTIIWDPNGSTHVLRGVVPGESVDFEFSISGIPFQPLWAIQAGPMLVDNGTICDFSRGSFQANIIRGRSPRTAVALTVHGELLMFVGEGRMLHHSLGFSLEEVAELLIEIGAHTAMNLDGGASSSLYVNGRYWGLTPSYARKSIPNAIIFGEFSRWESNTGSF